MISGYFKTVFSSNSKDTCPNVIVFYLPAILVKSSQRSVRAVVSLGRQFSPPLGQTGGVVIWSMNEFLFIPHFTI